MQITAHFSLDEFSRSATASRLGIDNTIPEALIPSIKNLCEQVLEPLREYYGRPVIISSGYRCQALNKALGGVGNSQHLRGEAADIMPPSFSPEGDLYSIDGRRRILVLWAEWIMDNCSFDQLILEKSRTSYWLHISCKPDPSKNRQQVIVINNK